MFTSPHCLVYLQPRPNPHPPPASPSSSIPCPRGLLRKPCRRDTPGRCCTPVLNLAKNCSCTQLRIHGAVEVCA
ncbi:hypothetical protein Ancab_016864 [Ancistrocladus abbreviatus]